MSENQKKIWITGASSGIGKAVAEKFAAEGWKVAVSARRKELLQELATNENIVSFPLDVTDKNQINTIFKNIIKVNFLGVVDCVKSVEEYFKSRKSGHISIVSSIAGYRGLPNSSGYGPSKAALTNFCESIYFDFKKFGVRVSVISPGFIKTSLTEKNEFPMPFLKTVDYAADKIFNGLVKSNSFEIHFPKGLTLTLKFLRILPIKAYLFLVDKLVKR